MSFISKVTSRYAIVAKASEAASMLNDVPAVQAAMKKAFSTKWVNYGDVNPEAHGGQFVRLDGDSVEVVETDDYEPHGKRVYIFTHASISAEDLSERGGDVISFVGAEKAANLEELIFSIVLGWVAYYGGDSAPYEVDVTTDLDDENYDEDAEKTYWGALNRYGIKESGS